MNILYFYIVFLCVISCTSTSTQKYIFSGFETGEIDKVWKKKKMAEGSWMVQQEKVRSGQYALRLKLQKGMKQSIGVDGKVTERVELKEKDKYHAKIDEIHRYKFSFYLPSNFPQKMTRLVLGQWKQAGKNSPVIAQRYVDGSFYVTISNQAGKKAILTLSKKDSRKLLGRWIDVDYKFKFSAKSGFASIQVGKHKAQYEGPLGFVNDGDNIYFKFGLYRDQIEESMFVYFDDYRHIIDVRY